MASPSANPTATRRARKTSGRTVRVHLVRDFHGARLPVARMRAALESIIRREHGGGTVQVIVVDDTVMRRLNRRFRGRDQTTDVLSFPLGGRMPGMDGDHLIGEIYCNYAHCRRWAAEHGGTIADEVLRLAVHGCLHLFGYDHHTPADNARMRRAEDRCLLAVGLIGARTAGESGRDA
ncbi:MAG TPA: rRNA maturation RNase YbeY [bacterium]|nr:rRNA maturation RNase YbeY [bacterium]